MILPTDFFTTFYLTTMSTNKNATIRYQALDRCFRDFYHRYFLKDLIRACEVALNDYNGVNNGVSRRQIFDDIKYMESEAGWNIPLYRMREGKAVYYRYANKDFSINRQPLTEEEAQQLETAILTLKRFKGIPCNAWIEEVVSKLECKFHLKGNHRNVIGFQQNEQLKGLHFLSEVIDAITHQQVLCVQYHNYKHGGRDILFTLHPYYVQQYNNRWFLIGQEEGKEVLSNLALDRIVSLHIAEEVAYRPNTSIDFEHYFDDIIGVSIPRENPQKEKIVFRVEPERLPYVTSKPLHASQQWCDEEAGLLSIEVIPNKELDQQLLSFGKDLEIISPQWYRDHFAEMVKDLYEKYFTN